MLSLQFSRGLLPVFLAVVMLALGQPAGSQQPISVEDQQPIGTMKVNVNVVNVYCNVKDKHGALVPDLHKEDFQLSEDGTPQTIKYFSAETDQPLTLGLLIDTSP